MKKAMHKAMWVGGVVLASSGPTYANNYITPTAGFSVLLIFPVVILGFKLAGAKLTEKEIKWRIPTIVFLVFCTFLLIPGTGIKGSAIACLAIYGVVRGVQAMARGQGKKRFALGAAVSLASLVGLYFLLASYDPMGREEPGSMALGILCLTIYGMVRGVQAIVRGQGKKRLALGAAVIFFAFLLGFTSLLPFSLRVYSLGIWNAQDSAIGTVRIIVFNETGFGPDANLDANKNGISEFYTLGQLEQANRIPKGIATPQSRSSYRFVLVLTEDPARKGKEFFVYATPMHYYGDPPGYGVLLLNLLRPPPKGGRVTYYGDETGRIRRADLGSARAVTREEAQKWPILD